MEVIEPARTRASTLLDTVTIPESVLKVWRETAWKVDEDGRIRTAKTCRCPLVEACAVIVGSVWANISFRRAAHELGISYSDATLIVNIADLQYEKYRPEFERLLGIRQ